MAHWTATTIDGVDADGNTATITYPDGYVYTYTYDELDRMTDVGETPAGSTTLTNLAHYAYDPLSRRTSLAYGNGTSTTYGYDAHSGLTSIAHAFVGTPTGVNITTTRDANERRASDIFSPGTAYVWHPPAAATTTYQPNALNQYTSINGQTLGYGGAGNLTSDPTAPLGSATYQWDLKNRLTAAGNPQHQASYGYDAFSRRAAKTVDGVTTVFVSDGSREIADYDSAGHELVLFVYGLDNAPIVEEPVDASGAATDTWYHHLDAIGTTVALTDHTGALYKAYATSLWGEVGGTQGTPFRFAGMRLDAETKLYYDNARYYSPQMGRFLSPDPIGTDGGINLYDYTAGDPINGVDPTGLDAFDDYLFSSVFGYYSGGGYYGSGYCDVFCSGGQNYGGSFPTLHSGQPSHPTTKPSSGSKSPPASGGAPNQSPPPPPPFEPSVNPANVATHYLSNNFTHIWGAAGAAVGAYAGGTALAGAVAVGTDGVGVLAGPEAYAAGAVAGAAGGYAVGSVLGSVADGIAATANGTNANSSASMRGTELYYLINRGSGAIDKIGVTSYPGQRYSQAYLQAENVRYRPQYYFQWRYAAYLAENIELTGYLVLNGQLPRLNQITR